MTTDDGINYLEGLPTKLLSYCISLPYYVNCLKEKLVGNIPGQGCSGFLNAEKQNANSVFVFLHMGTGEGFTTQKTKNHNSRMSGRRKSRPPPWRLPFQNADT